VKLCRRATEGGQRFYDVVKFTPQQVYDDPSIAWQKARIFHGGQWRKVRYKQVAAVYWQSASGPKPLRLFVVARIPYQVPGRERKSYGDPAFLLTTDLKGTPRELLQAYFDRWQIEVNHREEKDTLGVGQAQVRSPLSVPRQPAFAVAAYCSQDSTPTARIAVMPILYCRSGEEMQNAHPAWTSSRYSARKWSRTNPCWPRLASN
jgi:hypothetical protein